MGSAASWKSLLYRIIGPLSRFGWKWHRKSHVCHECGLINDFKMEAIINTGSAGAVAPGMAVGDIVLTNKLALSWCGCDSLWFISTVKWQVNAFTLNQSLLSEMKKSSGEEAAHILGLITTGDSIASEVATIREHFPSISSWDGRGSYCPSRSCSWTSFHGHSR